MVPIGQRPPQLASSAGTQHADGSPEAVPRWDRPSAGGDGLDDVSKLRELARLQQEGIITREEFESKKRELLARI